MNGKFYKFLFVSLLCSLTLLQTQAQNDRYLDEIFSGVSVEKDVVYANNLEVLTGSPVAKDLLMDVYTPDGDTVTERPVVVYFHTGSFLPPIINGGITGARSDSTVREVCTRLAKMGYVAIAATYRAGWNPAAVGPTGQNIRTGTLLNAAYRGIQDARSCFRFLRKTVAENSNRFGIDGTKIVAWGQGTGGYISLGCAFLDDFSEVVIDKFIDTETFQPYVDTSLLGNVYGLQARGINTVNHPGYSSDIQMAVNMGGALGDSSWIDGHDNEPPTIGFHVLKDPFAPFGAGAVIVPTTRDFVVNVIGTRRVVQYANEKGTNDPLQIINDMTMDPLNQKVNFFKNIPVELPGDSTTLAVDNMYPFITDGLESGPWDWWDKATLDLVVAGTNAATGGNYNSDTIHRNSLLTNPDMSAMKGRAYIDTIMDYFKPRACAALGLQSCLDALGIVNTIDANKVGLTMAPNPASEMIQFTTTLSAIKHIRLFDMSGKLMLEQNNIEANTYNLYRNNLPPGVYVAQLHFDEGTIVKKAVFK